MRKVEFLVAYDNQRWDTVIEDVPEEVPEQRLMDWANENLGRRCGIATSSFSPSIGAA